jgi:hypothetical protein
LLARAGTCAWVNVNPNVNVDDGDAVFPRRSGVRRHPLSYRILFLLEQNHRRVHARTLLLRGADTQTQTTRGTHAQVHKHTHTHTHV